MPAAIANAVYRPDCKCGRRDVEGVFGVKKLADHEQVRVEDLNGGCDVREAQRFSENQNS